MYAAVGFIFSPSQTAGLRVLPPDQNPFGVALMTTFVQIAGCVGPSLYTGIMSSGQGSALARGASSASAAADGFALAMLVAAVIAALGFALSFAYARAARARARAKAADAGLRAPQSVLAELMEADPYTLPASASVGEVMRAFVELKVGGLPLVDDAGRPAGFVSDGDVMRYLADKHPVIHRRVLAHGGGAQPGRSTSACASSSRCRWRSSPRSGSSRSMPTPRSKRRARFWPRAASRRWPVVREGVIVGTVNRSDVLRYAMGACMAAASE